MSRSKTVAVRLDPAELTTLRRIPGSTDSERVRALIMNSGINGGLEIGIARAVTVSLTPKLGDLKDQVGRAGERGATAVAELARQLNPILTELLQNTRRSS